MGVMFEGDDAESFDLSFCGLFDVCSSWDAPTHHSANPYLAVWKFGLSLSLLVLSLTREPDPEATNRSSHGHAL